MPLPARHAIVTRSSPSAQTTPSELPPPDLASPTPGRTGDPRAAAARGGVDQGWPPESLELAQRLQRSLTIDDRQWHRLKAQRPRRAAEQLAAALVQLLAADDPRTASPTRARQEAIALVDHALGWLRSEVSDPGCPSHGR